MEAKSYKNKCSQSRTVTEMCMLHLLSLSVVSLGPSPKTHSLSLTVVMLFVLPVHQMLSELTGLFNTLVFLV